MKVGFIGLGIMGSRMATNLVKKNFDVYVYNRTRKKAETLIKKGAHWGESPSHLAGKVDLLITMLSTPQAVHKLAVGENGFLTNLRSGTIWMDCSTVNPSFSQVMAQLAEQQSIHFLDAPVAGTKSPAEKGELIFLVGGKKQVVESCQPLFQAMGKAVKHMGENGKGTSMKMVFNLLLGQAMLAFSEALTLGESLGISQEVLLDSLLGGPVTAPFLAGKREKIENKADKADFPLQWMQKDLQLASDTAYEAGIALPTGNVVKEIFAMAKQKGYAKKDFSAIYHFLKE